jgi:hypothetical protein
MKIALPALVLISLLAGCSSGKAQVTFTKPEKLGSVYERFPGAYITSNRDGEYDVVLVNDALRAAGRHVSSKKPLQPIAEATLQQAIHIHVFWRPMAGAMVKESSVTNAIIHWYVFGNDGSRGVDMVHYEGAAFVMLDDGKNKTDVTIGDGQLAPRQIKGDLRDPVGPSRITGSITAVRDDSRVKSLLAAFQTKATSTEPAWTQAETDGEPAFGK